MKNADSLESPWRTLPQNVSMGQNAYAIILFMIWLFLIVLGWTVGVLVNYLCDVLPYRRRLAYPFCLKCNVNFPLWNYLFWPRRCTVCGQQRAWRNWFIEVIFILVSLALWDNHPQKLGFWGGLLLLVYFGIVGVIDIEHRLILHPVSVVGAFLGLLVGSYLHGLGPALLGGAVGFGSMFLLYGLGELLLRLAARLRGESVDDVALGFGDVNLSGVLGLLLGFPGIVLGLFIAIMLGGAISLLFLVFMLVMRRYRMFMALPYGPFLISGAVILLFFRDQLVGLFN